MTVDRELRPRAVAAHALPRDDRWMWTAAAVVVVVLGLVRLTFAVTRELDDAGRRVAERVFEETSGALIGAPAVFASVWLLRRFPLAGPSWQRALLAQLVFFVPVSLVHTTMLVKLRALSGPWFGFHTYGWAVLPTRLAYEGMTDLVHAVAIIGCFTAIGVLRERQARERRNAEVERALLDAELRTLRLRLEPHFLFNALNTISGTMYADVPAADAQLTHLSALLRAALRTSETQQVALREELDLLEHYVAIVRARFEERLVITVTATDEAKACLVPSLLLQPLVENAIRHGAVELTGHGVVTVSAVVAGGELRLGVHDDGPGLAPGRDPLDSGTGLSATVQRLRLLHGEAQRVTIGNVSGGFEVVIALPAIRAAEVAPPVPTAAPAAPAAAPAGVPA
ncbi:MAG: histidine kinase [Gemmatimonadetes bacterium]|nr:histidine kinase [Gemmatimonadota bacterium]